MSKKHKTYEPPPASVRAKMTPAQLDHETDKLWDNMEAHGGGLKTTGETISVKKYGHIDEKTDQNCPQCLGMYRAFRGQGKCPKCKQ